MSSALATAEQPTVAPIGELVREPASLAAWLAARSHDAGAAAARVEQARAVLSASRVRPNPEVSVGVAGVPVGATNPAGLGLGDTANYSAAVSQLVEIGKRGPRSEAARLRLAAHRQSYADALGSLLADARESMGRVLYLKSRQASIQEQLDIARQVVAIQQTRLDRGDLSGIDFDRLRLDAEMLEADLAQTRADYRDSLGTCAAVLLAECDPGNADLDTLAGVFAPGDEALPGDWEARLEDRPDLRALEAQALASAQDEVLAGRRKVPDPTLSVGYTRDHFVISGNNPRTVAVGVTIPLPTSDRGQHDAARARAEGLELRETAAATLSRARADALALRDRRAAIAAALDRLRGDALTRASGILASTSEAVSQGELSTTDLLLARRARTDVTLRVMDLQLQLFLVAERTAAGRSVSMHRSSAALKERNGRHRSAALRPGCAHAREDPGHAPERQGRALAVGAGPGRWRCA